MKKTKRRIPYFLCAAVMLVSMLAVPCMGVVADTVDDGVHAVAVQPEQTLDALHSVDILATFTTNDHFGLAEGNTKVDDARSVTGRAAKCSIRTDDYKFWKGKDLFLRKYGTEAEPTIGYITYDQLLTNAQTDGYTLYKFDNVYLEPSAYLFYMFEDWGFSVNVGAAFADKTVDIYLSMKVEGDVTTEADYYIDRIVVTNAEPTPCKFEKYTYNGDATLTTPGTVTETCIYCGKTRDTLPASADHVKLLKATDIFTFADAVSYPAAKISDPESSIGTAIQLSSENRKNIFVGANLPFGFSNWGEGNSTISSAAELAAKANKGYQIFKVSFTNLAIPDNPGLIYITDDWQTQSTALVNELKAYKGKNVDVYFSMKITGSIDGTGISDTFDETWPIVYIDRVMLVDDGMCPCECEYKYTYNGDATLTSSGTLAGGTCIHCGSTCDAAPASADHVKLLKAVDIFTFADAVSYPAAKISDPESSIGTAIRLSSQNRKNIFVGASLPFGFSNWGEGNSTISSAAELAAKANKGYQIFKVSFTNLAIPDNPGLIYITDDWQTQSTALVNELKAYKGKNVDVYFSMKITGSIDGTGISDTFDETWPIVYIDRVMLVDDGMCPCECEYEYAYNGDATLTTPGTLTETCIHCGNTRNSVPASADHVDLTKASDIQLFYTTGDPYADKFVTDPDSVVGSAAQFDRTMGDYTITLTGGGTIGTIKKADLKVNQGYQVYKFSFSNYDIADNPGEIDFSGDWGVRSTGLTNKLIARKGKNFDFYLSMKVTDAAGGALSFFIDRVMLVDDDVCPCECEFGEYVYNADATATSAGTMTASCIHGCGNTDTVPADADHVEVFCANSFTPNSYDEVVVDEASVVDSAFKISSYLRKVDPEYKTENLPVYLGGGDNCLRLTAYGGELVIPFEQKITADELIADGEYHVIKKHVDNLICTGATVLFFTSDWAVQNPGLLSALQQHTGESVDIYLSMRITGDIYGNGTSAESEDNWPVYYIDRVMLVSDCTFGEDAYFYDEDGNCFIGHTCDKCGKTKYEAVAEPAYAPVGVTDCLIASDESSNYELGTLCFEVDMSSIASAEQVEEFGVLFWTNTQYQKNDKTMLRGTDGVIDIHSNMEAPATYYAVLLDKAHAEEDNAYTSSDNYGKRFVSAGFARTRYVARPYVVYKDGTVVYGAVSDSSTNLQLRTKATNIANDVNHPAIPADEINGTNGAIKAAIAKIWEFVLDYYKA